MASQYRREPKILPNPRSPGTHIVGPWVIDSINLYRDLRTGTQYIGIWASRERFGFEVLGFGLRV